MKAINKNKPLPNRDYLIERFYFNESSGSLFWKLRELDSFKSPRDGKAWNSRYAGIEAGYVNKFGSKKYLVIGLDGSQFLAHRLIFKILHDEEPENIDHLDGNGLNNTPVNLRGTNCAGNHLNVMMSNRNTSGVVGVSLHKKSNLWRARINIGRINRALGYFADFDSAVMARKKAEIELGFLKNHGAKNYHG
ncbi:MULTISPECIES: HNH endonuclease [unclassified Serratia (in: enterobacteria)]|uniref:HNH endonuclease n=1 Tax=unclassified Serratia (in: enterobacteria) TaxID=2647522 RepID=UPI000692520C|nr:MULTISPECIES: HNH endonuclease [unclassified Serratia (in: enterobacteria)]